MSEHDELQEKFIKYRAYAENTIAQYTATNACLNIDLHLAKQDIIELTEQRDEVIKALEHIVEYWNRDENEKSMSDALWHIIDIASDVISSNSRISSTEKQ